ncbi:MAG TPA: extensin family protein, partial [Paracoccus sp. (in: a-proteobacteria)]|nr:extensin family protein [Paracoccus sp. (in: a-proteobacteria)]
DRPADTGAPDSTAAGPALAGPLPPSLPDSLRESDFDFAACRLALTLQGVDYERMPLLRDATERDCGIARPLRVSRILPGIALSGAADLRCDTARALAGWMREAVVPAAAHLPGAPRIVGIELGTAWQCRAIVGGASNARLSEHATGNAIDIAGFLLDDGTSLPIRPAPDRGDMAAAFQKAVQGSACLFFSTVLGPGSNAAHDDHLHLDIKARRGGFRLCQ